VVPCTTQDTPNPDKKQQEGKIGGSLATSGGGGGRKSWYKRLVDLISSVRQEQLGQEKKKGSGLREGNRGRSGCTKENWDEGKWRKRPLGKKPWKKTGVGGRNQCHCHPGGGTGNKITVCWQGNQASIRKEKSRGKGEVIPNGAKKGMEKGGIWGELA